MANWLKVGGIVLIVLGAMVILGSPVVLVGEEISVTPFLLEEAIGIVLAGVGVYLYHLGRKKQKGLVPMPKPSN